MRIPPVAWSPDDRANVAIDLSGIFIADMYNSFRIVDVALPAILPSHLCKLHASFTLHPWAKSENGSYRKFAYHPSTSHPLSNHGRNGLGMLEPAVLFRAAFFFLFGTVFSIELADASSSVKYSSSLKAK